MHLIDETVPVRVAIVDLYNRTKNEGMRAMRELLADADGRFGGVPVTVTEFETRFDGSVPDMSYDIVLSSGGPGSPFDGEGKAWEAAYFGWIDQVLAHNAGMNDPRYVCFICHSFQMAARHFGFASVTSRKSESFGIFPVHPTEEGRHDPLLRQLPDPFYAADFRNWQVVKPNRPRLEALGASILAREKLRVHVPLERAIMAVRLSPQLVGVQFHPEADPPGMGRHFSKPERKEAILKKVSLEKYERIMHRLQDPNYLKRTHDALLPGFLERAIRQLRPECFAAPVDH